MSNKKSEQEIIQMVVDYQNTKDEETFNKLYAYFEKLIQMKKFKSIHLINTDLDGALNEKFLMCVLDYDPKTNNNFSAYLATYLNFEVQNIGNKVKRNNIGAFTFKRGKAKHVKGSQIMSTDYLLPNETSKDKSSIGDLIVDEEASNWDAIDSEINLKDAIKRYGVREKDWEIIQLTLQGKKQVEICKILGVQQPRISWYIRNFEKRNPEFAKVFKEYLIERLNR